MMFLQDFDLHFVHVPGMAMGPADALSRLPNPDLSSDNTDVILLPDDLFISAIDTCYSTRSWSYLFHCTFTTFDY